MKRKLSLLLLLLSICLTGCRSAENPPTESVPTPAICIYCPYCGKLISLSDGPICPYCKRDVSETESTQPDDPLEVLRTAVPEYFGLSTDKGLLVYVWQMEAESYSFGLLPGTNAEKTREDLMQLKGISAKEMKLILSTYEIEESDIFVLPFQHPYSSYIAPIWITEEGEKESPQEREQVYVASLREMLFGDAE